jgi:hypothetical protein
MNRRRFLETSAALTSLGATSKTSASAAGERRIALRLVETAGLRRFGYPVSTQLPADLPAAHFRLTKDGREIPAQFRSVSSPDGRGALVLDWNASPGPFEVENYVVIAGDQGPPSPEPRGGMSVKTGNGSIDVTHPPYITYSLGEDRTGFLRSVRNSGIEFLKPNSPGFFVGFRGRKTYLEVPLGPTSKLPRVQVTRQGPMAAGLSLEHAIQLGEASHLASSIAMTFPSSKSWVEVVWTIADPEDRIESMGLDLDLRLEGEPILIDCGARSTVYTTLEPRERIVFESGYPLDIQGRELHWAVRKGSSSSPLFLEAAGEKGSGREPEGWVHVMDRTRCTAMAVADFGKPAQAHGTLDRFEIAANGLLRFERRFRTEKPEARSAKSPALDTKKNLRFWIHFVTMPVQVGAKTSSQAMLSPLEVRWERP